MKRFAQLLVSLIIIAVCGVYLGSKFWSSEPPPSAKSELSEAHFLLKNSYLRELEATELLRSAAQSLKPHLSSQQWESWRSVSQAGQEQAMLDWLEFLISGFDHQPAGVLTSQEAAYLALDGMLSDLDDPFTRVMNPEVYGQYKEGLESRPFGGVGLHLLRDGHKIEVFSVFTDSPAQKAGLQPGDELQKINDVSVTSVAKAQSLLQGDPGSEVTGLFQREAELFEVRMTRAQLQTRSVSTRLMEGVEGEFCWIKISGLKEETAAELEGELKTILASEPLGLVLDLRENMGGYVKSTLEVASLFLESGSPVVKVESRASTDVKATVGLKPIDLPLLVVVGRGTASSAEMLAGCFQDYQRAQIVGSPTYGKGSVQRIHEFESGGAVKYTTARYLTPKDRVLDVNGLVPDVRLEEEDIMAYCRRRWARKKLTL